jgi:hypothetical protein
VKAFDRGKRAVKYLTIIGTCICFKGKHALYAEPAVNGSEITEKLPTHGNIRVGFEITKLPDAFKQFHK